MNNELKAKVLFEVAQIDKLLNDSKPLFDLCKLKTPDFIELSACALVLHSFYGGIENMLILILKHYDEQLPNGAKWHMDLLDLAFASNEKRKQVFALDLKKQLEEYLKFRHFIRHAYGFQLEWERIEDLVNGINIFWGNARKSITAFLE